VPKLEPMQQPPTHGSGRRARALRVSTSLAEINVVPLVDVMLVLLVIFMVAAPMMNQGFSVQLPESSQSRAISEPVTVSVPASFRRDQRVRLGEEAIGLEALAERVKQALLGQPQQGVILASDGSITVQEIMTVVDRVIAGGAQSVAWQTQPLTSR
jgi:biopolymer transport protein ExbD